MKRLRGLPAPALILVLPFANAASAVKTEDEAIRRVVAAVHKFKLTTLSDGCWVMSVTEERTRFELVIREDHKPKCGGDPLTGPRLFTVFVRKRDGRMTTDAYDGEDYQPLKRKLRRP
jgi:hypothetical protein